MFTKSRVMEWITEETPEQQFPKQEKALSSWEFFFSSQWLEILLAFSEWRQDSPTQGRMVLCPTGLSNVPLHIQAGEKPAYNHLNLELKLILYINTKEHLHGFNKHLISQECNYCVNKGKVVFHFVQNLTKRVVCFTILENHFSKGNSAYGSWSTNRAHQYHCAFGMWRQVSLLIGTSI